MDGIGLCEKALVAGLEGQDMVSPYYYERSVNGLVPDISRFSW